MPAIALRTRRQWMHSSQGPPRPPFSQIRARAKARANVRFPTPSGPANSSAWGTRPDPIARSSRLLTRSWPRTSANAMQPRRKPARFDRLEQPRRDSRRVTGAIDHRPALGVLSNHSAVASHHPLVEPELLGLEPVGRATLTHPFEADFDGHFQEQQQIRGEAASGDTPQRVDGVEGDPAPVSLIGARRLNVAVRDYRPARPESGQHDLTHMLRAIREVEQQLCLGSHGRIARIEKDLAD